MKPKRKTMNQGFRSSLLVEDERIEKNVKEEIATEFVETRKKEKNNEKL